MGSTTLRLTVLAAAAAAVLALAPSALAETDWTGATADTASYYSNWGDAYYDPESEDQVVADGGDGGDILVYDGPYEGGGGGCRGGSSDSVDQVCGGSDDSAPAGTDDEGGSPSFSGCRTVQAERKKYYVHNFYFAYKIVMEKHFCWYDGRVTRVNVNQYLINSDWAATANYVRSWSAVGWFYDYFGGVSHSGQYSFRQATVENCVVKYGCVASMYPWVKIYAHGDGTWSSYRGG